MFNYWNVPTVSGQQIPDLTLDIGPPPSKRFAVHSSIVIHHSHYLRNFLGDCRDSTEKNLYLPTIASEHFNILLNFMYTGFLDISSENVFSVLLAAHTLHMPKVLEICTSFMLQHQLREDWSYLSSGNFSGIERDENARQCVKIVKPIASKARRADFNFISSPAACILLPSASETPFRAVSHTARVAEVEKSPKSPPATCLRDRNTPTTTATTSLPQCEDSGNARGENPGVSRTIVDIASCDGPVRFHRVLNLALFGQSPHPESEESSESLIFRPISLAKKSGKSNSPRSSSSTVSGEIYSCLHCKHTFRSQYCYLKHAKRHLYPPETVIQPTKSPPPPQPSVVRISPKLPDDPTNLTQSTNVQYYPCKICGCKFPSYYFVHKHRKMCHRNAHEQE
ncbi:uncharacterized protein DMENIID0001_059970 [Sergentomyia squamirostris]